MEKKVFRRGLAVLLLLLCLSVSALAEGKPTLVPMGTVVGIRLEADGLLVIGMAEEDGAPSPAEEAGLRSGDLITHVGADRVTTARQLREALERSEGEVSIRFLRKEKEMQVTLQPQYGVDGAPALGVWLRSSVSGIGTLTYYDPETCSFGALGHSVSDGDTGVLLPAKGGAIYQTVVDAVVKGSCGLPGELRGSLRPDAALGCLEANTPAGVFGRLDPTALQGTLGQPLELLPQKELRIGEAVLLSDVSGTPERYSVQILHVYRDGEGRDLLLRVTDPRLLALTGGIVQGMSGSPILKDGKFVGAVTHVLVNDPTRGYGISIENMLGAASADGAA